MTTCKLFIEPHINYILSKLKMENPLWSSPPCEGEHGDWKTPPCKTIHILAIQGKSDWQIWQETCILRSTVQCIHKQESSRWLHKTRPNKAQMVTARDSHHAIWIISKDYTSWCLTFECIHTLLGIKASAHTIWWELHQLGYWCCIACPWPFISCTQAKKRVSFTQIHQWWGTSDYAATKVGGDWQKVIFSDECTWETGRKGRAWITWWMDEKWCSTCIGSVYRSGRYTVMI